MAVATLGTAIRIGANLILIPLIVLSLAPSEQALWWVFIALGNFANLADFGLGQAITRVYNYFWAGAEDVVSEGLGAPPKQSEPNLPRIRMLFVTVRRLYMFLSLGAMTILGIVGTLLLVKPISAVGPDAQKVWLIWAVYVAMIGYNFWVGHWLLANQGTNQIRQMHVAIIWSSLAYMIVTSILLLNKNGLMAMVAGVAVRGVVMGWFARRAFHTVVRMEKGINIRPDFSLMSRLWPNARKFGVLSLGSYFIGNGSVLISSHFLGDKLTASVGLTNQVAAFIVSFASLWLAVKWPQITILRTRGKLEEMSLLFARRFGFVIGTYILLAITVLLSGNQILEWKSAETRLLPLPYLFVYLAYMGVQTFYVQFGMLTFTENVVPFFKISVFTGIGMMALSLVLTPMFGLWGLLLAPIISEWICSGWFTIRRGFQGQPLTIPQFWRAALFGHL